MTLAVVHNLPHGGQMRALYHQVKQLSLKHTIDLYSLSTSDNSNLSLKDFISKSYIFDYSKPKHFPQSVYNIYFVLPTVYKKMADQINSRNYDAVLVHPCFLTQSPYILRYLKAPSLYYCPEPKREFYENFPRVGNRLRYNLTLPFRLPLKNIDRQNAKKSTLILTNSQYSKKVIDQAFCVNAKVNYLGVDANLFSPKNIPKKNMVLSVGELSSHKGFDFIIRSLALIPVNYRPEYLIIGRMGDETTYLKNLAKERGVSLVIKNKINDQELINHYHQSKVFLYASRHEPFGLAILEAAACGLPVLAVNEGGVSEILTTEILSRTVERNELSFSKALGELSHLQITDKQLLHQHEFIKKRWSWEKSASELENYISQII